MTYKRRYKSARKVPKPYKSWLEYNLHKGPLKKLKYEPEKIPYRVTTTYCPDFVCYKSMTIYEAKGRFDSSTEASKYIHFRNCNPIWKIVFVFERPECPMPHAKRRKDGTKYTHADWADRNGFEWCSPDTVARKLKK